MGNRLRLVLLLTLGAAAFVCAAPWETPIPGETPTTYRGKPFFGATFTASVTPTNTGTATPTMTPTAKG